MAICVDIVPTPCGGTNKLTMKDVCNDVHFTGIEDTTINQGVGIDLTEGIHAYDGNGNEIEYTVTPDSIDKCDVGEHTVVYRTIGEGEKFLPSFCMDNVDVTLGDTFCNEILLEEDRIVTITQADPPTIEGIETIPTIYPNEEFDPTEGITATDDNGKTIDFTYSGRIEDSSEGAIASFETEFEQNALSVVADIEPIQDLHGYDKPWVGGAGVNLVDSSILMNGNYNKYNIPNPLKNGQTYTYSVYGDDTYYYRLMASHTNEQNPQPNIPVSNSYIKAGTKDTFVAPNDIEDYEYLFLGGGASGAGSASIQIQVEEGSVANPTYHPYSNICPISGRTECNTYVSPTTSETDAEVYTTSLGRTVYGGTLDVVSGVLTVTMGIADLGALNWAKNPGDGTFYTRDISKVNAKIEDSNTFIMNAVSSALTITDSNHLLQNSGQLASQYWNGTNGAIAVNDKRFTDATSFKTAMSGVQLCYELATPQTYQLTPQEVELLLGQNNVWADTGDIKVIYEKEMPASGNIEYLTAGSKIITYTATDECGNQTVERRIVYVLGDTPQVCMAEVCTAHVACEDNQ